MKSLHWLKDTRTFLFVAESKLQKLITPDFEAELKPNKVNEQSVLDVQRASER